jgi:hypothetical protein
MAIAAELSLPSGPLSAADWAAVSVAAASETSVTASAIVASATVLAVAVANNNNHPRNGHDVDSCLHDGHNDVIVDNSLTLSCSTPVVCPVDRGN